MQAYRPEVRYSQNIVSQPMSPLHNTHLSFLQPTSPHMFKHTAKASPRSPGFSSKRQPDPFEKVAKHMRQKREKFKIIKNQTYYKAQLVSPDQLVTGLIKKQKSSPSPGPATVPQAQTRAKHARIPTVLEQEPFEDSDQALGISQGKRSVVLEVRERQQQAKTAHHQCRRSIPVGARNLPRQDPLSSKQLAESSYQGSKQIEPMGSFNDKDGLFSQSTAVQETVLQP